MYLRGLNICLLHFFSDLGELVVILHAFPSTFSDINLFFLFIEKGKRNANQGYVLKKGKKKH